MAAIRSQKAAHLRSGSNIKSASSQPAQSQTAQVETNATFRPTKGLMATQTVKWPTAYKAINQGAHPGHEAWDIQAPQGSPIYAPVSGRVVKVVPMDPYGWGNAIQILSADGKFHLFFGHLQSFLVAEGQQVVAGQEIGTADSTYTPPGYSSGSHLHFEVRDESGKAIDPQIFFNDESLTAPVDPNGPTITLGKVQQSMGASTEPAANAGAATTAPAGIPTASPSQPSFTQQAASAAGAAAARAVVGTVSASKSSATAGDAAGVVSNAATSAVESGIQSALKTIFTIDNVAIIFGAIMLIIGVIQIGWKPVIKPSIEEGARVAGVTAKAALAG